MTSSTPIVRRALPSDREQAASTLGKAFGDDPVMCWTIGPGRDVAQRMTLLFSREIALELADDDHLVDVTADGCGVALWHDVDQWKNTPVQMIKMLPASIRTFGRRLPRAARTLAMIERVHPHEPHRYLSYLGVHPSRQGQGLGGALLSSMTAECDEHGLSAYLESSNPRNVPLYARHGFEERGVIDLPDGAPPVMAMWRHPR